MGLDIYFSKHRLVKEVGYFRKVNFLVAFFENNYYYDRNGADVMVDKEMAEDLLHRCEQVLEDHSKAKELLPTTDGFFFGNTDYDEYYFTDVQDVHDWIKSCLIPEIECCCKNEYIQFHTWW